MHKKTNTAALCSCKGVKGDDKCCADCVPADSLQSATTHRKGGTFEKRQENHVVGAFVRRCLAGGRV